MVNNLDDGRLKKFKAIFVYPTRSKIDLCSLETAQKQQRTCSPKSEDVHIPIAPSKIEGIPIVLWQENLSKFQKKMVQ